MLLTCFYELHLYVCMFVTNPIGLDCDPLWMVILQKNISKAWYITIHLYICYGDQSTIAKNIGLAIMGWSLIRDQQCLLYNTDSFLIWIGFYTTLRWVLALTDWQFSSYFPDLEKDDKKYNEFLTFLPLRQIIHSSNIFLNV